MKNTKMADVFSEEATNEDIETSVYRTLNNETYFLTLPQYNDKKTLLAS